MEGTFSIGAVLFLILILAICILDVAMFISLVKPGDERKMIILWKTCTYTFAVVVGWLFLEVLENLIRGYQGVNPFTMLSVISILYFITLLYQKQKHGG